MVEEKNEAKGPGPAGEEVGEGFRAGAAIGDLLRDEAEAEEAEEVGDGKGEEAEEAELTGKLDGEKESEAPHPGECDGVAPGEGGEK